MPKRQTATTCDLFISTCDIIMLTCDIIMLTCDLNYDAFQHIIILRVDVYKSRVYISMYINIIYLAYVEDRDMQPYIGTHL